MIDLPVCAKGDAIEYQVKNAKATTKGSVISRTDLFITVSIPKRFGNYPETIHRNDLITGDITILAINSLPYETQENATPPPENLPSIPGLKVGGLRRRRKAKGVKPVAKPRIERPTAEILDALFEKAGYNISRAAMMCEPQVSKATMGRWLKELGIITPSRVIKETPPSDELRQAWEDAERSLIDLGRRYVVTPAIAKQWLLDAGIIFETFTGVETADFTPEDEETNRFKNPEQTGDINDHEIIKKLVDFCLAPLEGRIEKAEDSIGALANIMLTSDSKRDQVRPERIRKLAELVAAVLEVI